MPSLTGRTNAGSSVNVAGNGRRAPPRRRVASISYPEALLLKLFVGGAGSSDGPLTQDMVESYLTGVLILLCHKFSPLRTCWHCSLTARAPRQVLGEDDDQASAHGGDRIWNVALGPQRWRRGVGNRRERQVLRTAWRDQVLRGESSPARRPRSRKSRCTSWRGGGSRAIRGLRNGRARPPA